jgi:DNA-binding NtrC family response regulator
MNNAADAKLVAIALDDANQRRTLREGFERAGHRTIEVARGADGAFALDDRVSLVVLGVRDASGLDRLRALQSRAADAAVIVTTTAPRAAVAADALRLGAYEVLEAPVEPARVVHVADRALEHRALALRVRSLQERLERFERAQSDTSATRCACGAPHPPTNGERAATDEETLLLRELERRAIAKALARTRGSVEKAARLLGIGRATLYRRLGEEKLAQRASQQD